MYEKIAFGAITMFLMFLIVPAFADNDTDWLAQKEHDLEVDFFATVDCDNPNAISGFIWNFSNGHTQAEQCKIYQTASKLLQLFRVMEVQSDQLMESSPNHTILPGNAYHSDDLHFPDDAYN